MPSGATPLRRFEEWTQNSHPCAVPFAGRACKPLCGKGRSYNPDEIPTLVNEWELNRHSLSLGMGRTSCPSKSSRMTTALWHGRRRAWRVQAIGDRGQHRSRRSFSACGAETDGGRCCQEGESLGVRRRGASRLHVKALLGCVELSQREGVTICTLCEHKQRVLRGKASPVGTPSRCR